MAIDHLGKDQRKTKEEKKDEIPIKGKIVYIVWKFYFSLIFIFLYSFG